MKKCKNCKKDFEEFDSLQAYCSPKCYYKANPTKTYKDCAREGCQNRFTPFLTTQKHCSKYCYYLDTENAAKRKRAKIKKKSKKQAEYDIKYSLLRKAFLLEPKNRFCCKYPNRIATTVHHMMGRGINVFADDWAEARNLPLLLDTRYWKAASMEGHEWIERNPEEAKRLGFSMDRLKKR